MNADYKIFPERELVEIRYWDRVDSVMVLELVNKSTHDPGWSPGFDLFVDLSWVTAVDINFNQMMGISHRGGPCLSQGRPSRMAILAPDDTTFGTARMYATLMDPVHGVEVEAFRDLDEAQAYVCCHSPS